jgi:hypothetical protein
MTGNIIATGTRKVVTRRRVRLVEEITVQYDKEKKINPWFLGKMFESIFPHTSGREEG